MWMSAMILVGMMLINEPYFSFLKLCIYLWFHHDASASDKLGTYVNMQSINYIIHDIQEIGD